MKGRLRQFILSTTILLIIGASIVSAAQTQGLRDHIDVHINFTSLNQQLETLNPSFLEQFTSIYTAERISTLNDQQIGDYLFLLGKMYIYDILPQQITGGQNQSKKLTYKSQSRYLLGYFYLQIAAEVYEQGDAYYYLAVLEFIKLTPTTLIKTNIKNIIQSFKKKQGKNKQKLVQLLKQWKDSQINGDNQQLLQYLEDLAYDMESHHLHNTQHNLYIASLLGQTPAKLSLAYMLKDGISTEKNCSAAIAYYLSVLKSTKIDTFQFPSDYVDRKSFQKQLYSRKKVDLSSYGQYDSSVLMHTSTFDQESLHAYEDIAMKYMTGEDGFPVNQAISAKMLEKITQKSKLARIMLGFLYLKGRGVNKNFKKARFLFETDAKTSKVAKETLLVMKFYNLGFQNQKANALRQMKSIYEDYIKNTGLNISSFAEQTKQSKGQKTDKNAQNTNEENNEPEKPTIQQQQKSASKNQRSRVETFRTPMIKYLVGSLVLSDDIKTNGDKRFAINLIDQAAKQGNTLALTQLGLIFIDGSDSSFDCDKAAGFFAKQALSHASFQQRVQMAKLGIKFEKYMFSLIKYVQLMMVGYHNAFINAFYLIEVYRDKLFDFNKKSWSVEVSKQNQVYKFLAQNQLVEAIDLQLYQSLGFDIQHIFEIKNMQYLTQNNFDLNALELEEYANYIKLKIISIGIQKHQISILRFYKYKQTKDIKTLHELANLGESSPHIYQSRFLLGRYYHHTNISGTVEDLRNRRAIQEYNRATKNKLLAELIYLIEGGEFKESQAIFSHFFIFLTIVLVLGILLYRQRNKRIEQIYQMEEKKRQEQQQREAQKMNKNVNESSFMGAEASESELKKNQFLFKQKQKGEEYKGPKFSEQEQQNMINSRNLLNIQMMIGQKMKALHPQQNRQTQELKIIDNSQPIILQDEVDEPNRN